jgi:hypothetical protein
LLNSCSNPPRGKREKKKERERERRKSRVERDGKHIHGKERGMEN